MLKKLFSFTLLALAGNFVQASKKPKHPKPKQEEQAPEAKKHKAVTTTSRSSGQDQATTSLAASPASNTDKPANSLVVAPAETITQKFVERRSPLLDVVAGGQKPLHVILLAYLDEWQESKTLTNGYRDVANSVAWSPNGKYIASGSGKSSLDLDGKYVASDANHSTVNIWDVATDQIIKMLKGHNDVVTSVAYSPDGNYIASGSCDNTIKIWDVETGKKVITLSEHTHAVLCVAWSPDGKQLASASSDNTIKIWDLEYDCSRVSLKQIKKVVGIKTLTGHSDVASSVAWRSDSKQLVSGSCDNTIRIWDAETGKEVKALTGHSMGICTVAYSRNSNYIASGSYDHTIRIWEVETGKEIKKLIGHEFADISADWSHHGGINSVAWSHDSKQLASGAFGEIKIWDVSTGTEVKKLDGHSRFFEVSSVAWSPNGQQLAAGSHDKTIKIWNNQAREIESADLQALSQNKTITSASAAQEQALRQELEVVTNGQTPLQDIILGYLAGWREVKTLTGHSDWISSVAWNQDCKQLRSASGDGTQKIWDVASGKVAKTRPVTFPELVAVSPDNKYSAVRNYSSVVIFSTITGQKFKSLAHPNFATCQEWSPDGTQLATCSGDNVIKIWDVATGIEIKTLTGNSHTVTAIALSPDNTQLASGSHGQTIKITDIKSGTVVTTLTGDNHTASIAWSPVGNYLAVASVDGKTIKIWDVATGIEIKTLTGHRDYVWSVAWSPDGEYIASGSSDKTIKIWKKY